MDDQKFYIVQEPGKVPRIGHPLGDFDQSLDEWMAANPTAEIYIVTAVGGSVRLGSVSVELASEYVAIREAMKDAEFPESEFGNETGSNNG